MSLLVFIFGFRRFSRRVSLKQHALVRRRRSLCPLSHAAFFLLNRRRIRPTQQRHSYILNSRVAGYVRACGRIFHNDKFASPSCTKQVLFPKFISSHFLFRNQVVEYIGNGLCRRWIKLIENIRASLGCFIYEVFSCLISGFVIDAVIMKENDRAKAGQPHDRENFSLFIHVFLRELYAPIRAATQRSGRKHT
jgi:hypothetical protein